VRNEIAVLKKVSLGHRNILSLVDYFETMNNLYLVTDLALGGELIDRISRKGSFYEKDAADLLLQLVSAVAYLHDHGIAHRDLKPENLLFRTPEEDADLLIADFGLSSFMDDELFDPMEGERFSRAVEYQAPECYRRIEKPGKPVDMWAVGVITYLLLCGYTPFDRDNMLEEMKAILSADYSFTPIEYWKNTSMEARDFIKRCLTIDPKRRITAHEALQHPFLRQNGNEKRKIRQPLPATGSRIFCDVCQKKILDIDLHFHCTICQNGNFGICEDCIAKGDHCKDKTHSLVKRVIKDGEIVSVSGPSTWDNGGVEACADPASPAG
jgi:serine/threonine protein kinase